MSERESWEMPLDEAMAKAEIYSERYKDVPSVDRTLLVHVKSLQAQLAEARELLGRVIHQRADKAINWKLDITDFLAKHQKKEP